MTASVPLITTSSVDMVAMLRIGTIAWRRSNNPDEDVLGGMAALRS